VNGVRFVGILCRLTLLVILFSGLLQPARAEDRAFPSVPPGRLAFRSYGSEQGLTNLSMWSLEQDGEGFLWVGTESGLFRYDGNRFQRFSTKDGLPADLVRVVFAAKTRALWLGTLQGVAIKEGNRIQALGTKAGLNTSEVFAFAEDREGRIWVGADHGLFRQKPGQHSFEPMPGWPSQATARALWLDASTAYVVSGIKLFAYDLPTASAPREVPGPWTERLDSVARDGMGRLWVRTRAQLWMQPATGGAFVDMNQHLSGTAFFDGALKIDPAGNLLIPMAEGLARLKGETWEYLGENQGLPTPWVNRTLVDREGSLWVCGTGLHRSLGREVWRQYTQRDGIPGSVVQSLMLDRQARFWIGTALGVCQANPKGWNLLPETRGVAVLAMLQTPDGAIWMGGGPPFLLRWDPRGNAWQNFKEVGSTVTKLHQDVATGDILMATRRMGLWRAFSQGSGYSTEPISLPKGSPDERIQDIAGGGQGRIWIAGSNGLVCHQNGQWVRFTVDEGLESLHVMAVLERPNGDLWLSYLASPGLFRYAVQNGRLNLLGQVDTRSGLSSDLVHFIREDALGQLWVGTSLGINRIIGASIHSFGTGEGLPGDDCNANAFLAQPNGNVWVGTLGGLARFNAASYQGFSTPPPTRILSATFGSKFYSLPHSGELNIPHREANPEIRFAGLSFLNESKVQHQIRLLGYEQAWRSTDIRQANYTNLPPGSYRFEVRAGYGAGHWGATAMFPFQINPSWWQTWWFRTFASLGILGTLTALVWWRLRSLRKKNALLDQLVNERTLALAEANQTLQQLTVTDPLTGLKNRRYLDLTIEDDLAKVHRDHHSLAKRGIARMAVNIDMLFLMIDMDHFKQVNDTYGHAVGDSVLQQLRDRLLAAVRDTDTVIRWGGEEFLVVAKGSDRAQADVLAERILSGIRDRPFHVGGEAFITKTCSLGFSPYPCEDDDSAPADWHKVVEVADRCLYAAKKSGRNGWVGVQERTDHVDLGRFLEDPSNAIEGGAWALSTSFSDPQGLLW